MSKEKVSSQEVIDLVASKSAVSKRASEEFIKIMISTIEEALMAGEIVKIKNFGTFKLQWNEPRKSVNVQTGEDIILAGYHKVAFTPDAKLRDLVNEPFGHLEPVSLDGEPNDSVQTEPVLDPLRTLNEQAFEINDILAQINEMSQSAVIQYYFETEVEEKKENEAAEIKKEEIKEELPPQIQEEEIIEIQEELIQPIQSNFEEKPVSAEETYYQPMQDVVETESEQTPTLKEPKPNKRKAWLWVLISLLILSGIVSGLYYFYPPLNEFMDTNYTKSKFAILKKSEHFSITEMVNTISGWFAATPKQIDMPETVVIPKDTSAMDSVEQKPQVDSLQMLFDNPRVYTFFVGTERIKRGSRLTIMSKRYYGNKNFWVYIYEANRDHIPNPDDIPVGTLIRIPKLDPRLIDASNERCIQKAKELHDIYVK